MQFDADTNEFARSNASLPMSKGMIGFLQKHHIVKDEKTAKLLLVGVAVLCVLAIVFVVSGSGPAKPLPPKHIPLNAIPAHMRK